MVTISVQMCCSASTAKRIAPSHSSFYRAFFSFINKAAATNYAKAANLTFLYLTRFLRKKAV